MTTNRRQAPAQHDRPQSCQPGLPMSWTHFNRPFEGDETTWMPDAHRDRGGETSRGAYSMGTADQGKRSRRLNESALAPVVRNATGCRVYRAYHTISFEMSSRLASDRTRLRKFARPNAGEYPW